LTDTIGLNEADKGTMPSHKALKNLITLLHNSAEGYNLLVHVMRIPRITKSHQDNYELFVKTIASGNIPTILVATGCENHDPMSEWPRTNAAAFTQEGLRYEKVVGACFAKGGRLEEVYAKLRDESRAAVLSSIVAHASRKPVKVYEGQSGFLHALKRA